MMTADALGFEANVLSFIESRPEGVTEKELASQFAEAELKPVLGTLSENDAIEKRAVGGMTTWYPLFKDSIKKVLIVEDDENINNLMKASLGKGYEIAQSFDGTDALEKVMTFKPELVLLDLMLPGVNGLDICKDIKSNDATKNLVVIIVSAADERRNRFVSIKYGADYYVKKPFEPKVLRALANIFLRKKGKRFDPLIDLPDTERLSKEVELAAKDADFEANNIRISGLEDFRQEFSEMEANAVVRLLSQIIQDKIREWASKKGAVGYIGGGEFVVCGGKNESSAVVKEVTAEFERVLPFIYQAKELEMAIKQAPSVQLDLADVFSSGKNELKRVSLKAAVVPIERILEKREKIIEKKPKRELGEYTLTELQEMLGSANVDLTFSATPDNVSISISKPKK